MRRKRFALECKGTALSGDAKAEQVYAMISSGMLRICNATIGVGIAKRGGGKEMKGNELYRKAAALKRNV